MQHLIKISASLQASQRFFSSDFNSSQLEILTCASKLSFLSISDDSGVFFDLFFNSGRLKM